MDHLCYLCIVFVMLSRLFIASLWLPEGKRLTSWLLFVMFIVILLLSRQVCYLIVSIPDHLCIFFTFITNKVLFKPNNAILARPKQKSVTKPSLNTNLHTQWK